MLIWLGVTNIDEIAIGRGTPWNVLSTIVAQSLNVEIWVKAVGQPY